MTSLVLLAFVIAPALLAVTLAPWLPIGLRPDFAVLALTYLALFARDRNVILYPVLAGLLLDIASLTPVLTTSLIFVIVFRVVHRNRTAVYRLSPRTQLLVTLSVALAVHAMQFAVLFLATGYRPPLLELAQTVALLAFPTALLAPLTYAGLTRLLIRAGFEPTETGDLPV